MKTVRMDRDFYHRPHARAAIKYKAGVKYTRVPEAAVTEILKAKAGSIVVTDKTPLPVNRYA